MSFLDERIAAADIERKLKDIVYIQNTPLHSIQWGMNYIFFAPSKRVRPLLCIESNKVYGNVDNDSYILSAAIETIHTYSLVHDDLPCMDDDGLRRGLPTLHTVVNEAYAVLVGDALLTRGYGLLGEYSKPEKLGSILKVIESKSGWQGMILGQHLDMDAETRRLSENEINLINLNKTSRLLQMSLLLGAINGGADNTQLEIMDKLGEYLGYIFQIKDDILDITSTTQQLGKPVGSDENNDKSSLPRVIGIDAANKCIDNYRQLAVDLIDKLPNNRDFFTEFTDFLVNRTK